VTESTRQTDPSLPHALRLARQALEVPPSGLLTDFDGTLSEVADEPGLARLVDGAAAALVAVDARLQVVAVITGRASADARRLIGIPSLLIVGNHGAEWLEPGLDTPMTARDAESTAARLDAVLAVVPTSPGVIVEHKRLSATIHYRNASDPDASRAAILDALATTASDEAGVSVGEGRMSVELRPLGLADKGSAARSIIEREGLAGVVVMGDDVTDLDMFRAVAELRAGGRIRAAIIAVGGADREVPATVSEAADVTLQGPRSVVDLLVALGKDPLSA